MTDSMTVDTSQFRQVMRKFATGVTILTVREGDEIHGMTANAFASVSLDPLLVLVCIAKNKITHDLVTRTGIFAVNILGDTQTEWARRFAHQVNVPNNPFADILYHSAATGAPIFNASIAYVDCRVIAAHEAGDHTIFIGHVEAAGFGNGHSENPLLWFNGQYTSLDDEH